MRSPWSSWRNTHAAIRHGAIASSGSSANHSTSLPLPEGDPDRRRLTGRDGLVDLLLLLGSILPCRGLDGLQCNCEVRSHGLTSGWRRLLTLEGDGVLETTYAYRPEPLPTLEAVSSVTTAGGSRLDGEWRAEAHRGLTRFIVKNERGSVLADFRLQST